MKQKGIVLISTLIFLVVILLLLKIVLGGSLFAEKKAGAIYEIHNAKSAAQLAQRKAEEYILAGGYSNGVANISVDNIADCKGLTEKDEDCYLAIMTARYEYWNDLAVSENGVYLDDNKTCTIAGKQEPLYQCADWGTNYNNYLTSSPKSLSTITVDNTDLLSGYEPKFMIIIKKLDNESLQFNVISVGFGQQSSATDNVSNVMLSATYILM